ncbi:hypothetical protein ACFQH6_09820 [Halobacteriaceae archaeon GCM10025711]
MDPDDRDGQTDHRRAAAFAEALDDLKRRGSMLLLVGPGHHDAPSAACQRLLGAAVSEPRRRLYVMSGGTPATHASPMDVGGDHRQSNRTIVHETTTRSATTASAGTPAGLPARTVTDGLSELHAAVEDEIAAFERDYGDMDPAELRVCLDSVDALLATYDEEDVFEFLHAVAGTMRATGGMCHVHLPTDPDSRVAHLLEPLFDAVIEVRDEGGTPSSAGTSANGASRPTGSRCKRFSGFSSVQCGLQDERVVLEVVV